MLEKEYQYFLDNEEKLLNIYRGKYIVIKDGEVIASYNTIGEAYIETVKDYELGTFMIHKCIPEEEQIQYLGPRVIFE